MRYAGREAVDLAYDGARWLVADTRRLVSPALDAAAEAIEAATGTLLPSPRVRSLLVARVAGCWRWAGDQARLCRGPRPHGCVAAPLLRLVPPGTAPRVSAALLLLLPVRWLLFGAHHDGRRGGALG